MNITYDKDFKSFEMTLPLPDCRLDVDKEGDRVANFCFTRDRQNRFYISLTGGIISKQGPFESFTCSPMTDIDRFPTEYTMPRWNAVKARTYAEAELAKAPDMLAAFVKKRQKSID